MQSINFESVPDIASVNYDYDYPGDNDFRPGHEKHDMLVKRLMEYATSSSQMMSTRHDKWAKIDHTLTAYIRTDADEQKIQWDDDRKPTSIVIPTSYANLQTLLTYQVAAFLESPFFRYEAWGTGNDEVKSLLMQHAIELQNRRFKNALALYTMWRDAIAYGIGPAIVDWEQITGRKRMQEQKRAGLFANFSEFDDNAILFEGNKIFNIDPYNYLPDTNVPIHEVGRAEMHGYIDRTNRLTLLGEEEQENSAIFNARYLKHIAPRQSNLFKEYGVNGRGDSGGYNDRYHNSDQPRIGSIVSNSSNRESNVTDVIYLYMTIVPRDWELGGKETPEN